MIYRIYTFIFARKIFFKLNRFLFKLSIHGLGIRNNANQYLSGENAFIKNLIKTEALKNGVVFDVGANIGDYSIFMRENGVVAPIFVFEPHPQTYQQLISNTKNLNLTYFNSGLGDATFETAIFDYKTNNGSQHASIYKEVIEDIHKSEAIETKISITTLDSIVEKYNIEQISLLKIDTEGNELSVIKGAAKTITASKINYIQIEFNEMNIISHTFLRDFIRLLPNYKFYRLLPTEMLEIKEYTPLYHELFAFQNIIAVKDNV
jgi:FkbM family methyltransferase